MLLRYHKAMRLALLMVVLASGLGAQPRCAAVLTNPVTGLADCVNDSVVGGTGLNSLNAQTGTSQTFAVPGTAGTAPAWTSATNVHTLNIPLASASGVTAGLVSKADYDAWQAKLGTGAIGSTVQAWDADLDALAALSTTGVMKRTGPGAYSAGALVGADLPNPGASSLGGVRSLTCGGTDKLSAIGTDGIPVCSADQTGGAGSLTVENNDVSVGTRAILNLVPGTFTTVSATDTGTQINATFEVDTALVATKAVVQAGGMTYCASTASGAASTCSVSPALTAYTTGQVLQWVPDAAIEAAHTLNVNGVGAVAVKMNDGSDPTTGSIASGRPYWLMKRASSWTVVGAAGGGTTVQNGIYKQTFSSGATSATVTHSLGLADAQLQTISCFLDESDDREIGLNSTPSRTANAIGASFPAASGNGYCLAIVAGGSAGGLANAYTGMTDGSVTASASGSDTFKFRSASNLLTVAVASNDVTHGDNALFTVNQGNFSLGSIGGSLNLASQVTGTLAESAIDAAIARDSEVAAGYQPLDADLTALAALASSGLVARTGAGTVAARTLTGTANEVTVTNGDGVSGAPTISLPAAIDLGGKTSFEVPNGAAPTVNVFGQLAGDNNLWAASRGAILAYDGTAATALVGVLVSDTPSAGQVPKWNADGTITWENDSGGGAATSITSSTTLPGTCTAGDVYFDTDATSGARFYVCDSANNWHYLISTSGSGTGVLSLLEGTAPGAGGSAGLHNVYFDSADSLMKSHENAGSVVTYYSTANPQTSVSGNAGTATALAANPTDCSANQFANAIAANGNLTCAALTDSDVPDSITVSNYLPLAGGTLTGQLVTDNLGIEFEESDTNPTCAAGNYTIYADLSENKLKKCVNGSATDLDTTGGTPDFGTLTGGTNNTAGMIIGAGASLRTAAGILGLPNGTSLPGTCTVGDIFMDTDATSGQRIYACESSNTWVLQGGGGSGMSDPMTNRGDMIYRNSSNTTARLPVGTGFLKADGTDVTGYATIATTDLPARTKRFSLLNGSVLPDTTGDVFQEPYTTLATNDVWRFGTWRFGASNSAQPTVRSCLAGHFSLPSDVASTVSTANAVIVWSGTGTTGNVVWDFDYRIVGGNDTTSLDQSGTQEAVTVTDAMPGAANRRLVASVALTAGNFSGQADTSLEWKVCRDGADGADTAAFSALLKDVLLEVTVR